MENPTDEQIRERAHQLWERAGRPNDRQDEFWLQAERELHEMDTIAKDDPSTVFPG